jgi:hypothetical protein
MGGDVNPQTAAPPTSAIQSPPIQAASLHFALRKDSVDFYVEHCIRLLHDIRSQPPKRVRESVMSKVFGLATVLALALSWFAVSCAGPEPAKAGAAGAITAGATVPGSAQSGAATTPLAEVTASNRKYFVYSLAGFAALGAAVFFLRGKPPEMA